VSVVEPLRDPKVACIVVCPCATVVKIPLELIVPTLVAEELHETLALISSVVWSEFVAIAANR